MTLTTHAIIATAITKPLLRSHPVFIFLVALASHYISDSVPHWDYALQSVTEDTDYTKRWKTRQSTLVRDLLVTASDAIFGAAASILLIQPKNKEELIWTTLVIVGSMLPDFLQGVYFISGCPAFLRPVQRFHDWAHTSIRLGRYPLLGIPFQILIAGIFVLFFV